MNESINKIHLALVLSLVSNIILIVLVVFLKMYGVAEKNSMEMPLGANQVSGMMGRYTYDPPSVGDGNGSAIATDAFGRPIISSTTVVTITTQ